MICPSLPLITVIVAVYNGSKTLQQCIDSVSDQVYQKKQLMIIDGGSKDNSVDILKLNDHNVDYWISEPDNGIYSAWNKALLQAEGEWVCFLGSDDFFVNADVLTRVASELAAVSQRVNVVYGQLMLLTEGGSELYLTGQPWEEVKERFKQVMCIPHPATMHRRTLFTLHGGFDESFRIAADYEFLLRELKIRNAVFVSDLVISAMRQGGISSNPTNTILALKEVRRAQKKNGAPRPGSIWIICVVRAYLRLFLWRLLGEKAARRLLDVGRYFLRLPPYWTRTS